jgi:glycosyltransferase involved in cell wall biosynthesis
MAIISAILPTPVKTNQTQPFWSVMIPTYRPQEAFLRKTLESVLQQDPGADQMQIEVVDDCSPDVNVEEIVRSIAGARVRVARTPKNLGLAGAFNICIERACGQWVHILNHDDYVLPGFYDRLRGVAEQHPEVALVACRSFHVDEGGVILGVSPQVLDLKNGGRAAECFFYANPIWCPGVVMRRKFYETHGGFRPDLLFVLDVEMWARAVGLEGGVVIADVLACFRSSQGQATSRLERAGDSLRDIERLIQIYAERYPAYNRKKSMLQLCEQTFDRARHFSKAGDAEAAKANWSYWRDNMPVTMRLSVLASRVALTIARRLSS